MTWRTDFKNVPEGAVVDLWVWRGNRTIKDCYFPKCYHSSFRGWVSMDDECTTIGHPDLWRMISPPGFIPEAGRTYTADELREAIALLEAPA